MELDLQMREDSQRLTRERNNLQELVEYKRSKDHDRAKELLPIRGEHTINQYQHIQTMKGLDINYNKQQSIEENNDSMESENFENEFV